MLAALVKASPLFLLRQNFSHPSNRAISLSLSLGRDAELYLTTNHRGLLPFLCRSDEIRAKITIKTHRFLQPSELLLVGRGQVIIGNKLATTTRNAQPQWIPPVRWGCANLCALLTLSGTPSYQSSQSELLTSNISLLTSDQFRRDTHYSLFTTLNSGSGELKTVSSELRGVRSE